MLSPIVLLHTNDPEPARDTLQRTHPDLTIHTCSTYADLSDSLRESQAEVVYTVRFDGTPDFPGQALHNATQVKWISVGGSGTDHLLRWDKTRCTVTNAAGVAADMMAEYALGCVLSFRLNLRQFQQAQQQQQWITGKVTPLAGQTALLIGMGQTGIAVAQRFKAMDMRVIGVRASAAATSESANFDKTYTADALPDLLPQADVIVVAVPLLKSTRGMLAGDEFSAMKPNTILVDVSRGGVVDETALIEALHSGSIEGAALDVFSTEPLPAGHPLWQMNNAIVTPHCSSVYDGWELRSVEMFAENLMRYRQGNPLDRIVDPDKGY
jgi:phosphoglycerate dehydrogenase-like enzyme